MCQALKKVTREVRRPLAVLLGLLLLSSPAYAQWDMNELLVPLDRFNSMIGQFCNTAGQAGDYIDFGDSTTSAISWVCALQPSISRVRDMAEGLTEDITGFFSESISQSFSALSSAVGFELGDTDLSGLINESINEIGSGEFSITALTGKLLEKVNRETLASLEAPPAANASELEKQAINAARADPVRFERELDGMERRSQAMMSAAQAQDTSNTAQQLAASSLARGDEEKLMKRVTNPNPVQGKQGTADVAQDRGRDANSTRAAIQALVQAQADFMRQTVVSDANIVTALKEQAVQQVFTTQQVGALAKSLSDEQLRDYNEWREEYFSELGKGLARAEDLRSNFGAAVEILGGTP